MSEFAISKEAVEEDCFDEQEMRDCLPSELKIAVCESRNARYMGYPVDDMTNLAC